MKTIKLTLPEFWASALINNDFTGLKNEEENEFIRWGFSLDKNIGLCIDASEEKFFTKYHDASEFILACDWLEYTFEVVK